MSWHDNLWSDGELEVLREWYESRKGQPVNLELLSKLMGRSKPNICRKARELGLTEIAGRERSPEQRRLMSANSKSSIEKNGHPRGMLGKKHSPELKSRMSKISKERWAKMSDAERQSVLDASYSARKKNGSVRPPQNARGSWKAGWREIGGKRNYYRSRWEANYARYLEFLRRAGDIKDWQHEPKTFWFEKIKRGVRSYKPDFLVVTKTDAEEWHEVKGWMDSRSRTTLKRMKKYHPDETIVLIDEPKYKQIMYSVGVRIQGWE